jgi:two-component system, cell cycle response regulator
MHRHVRSIPAPGCCIDRPVNDPAAVAGDPARPVSVLLLEDSRTDALLVSEALHHSGAAAFTVTVEETLAGALAHLARAPVDVALVDLTLPDSEGLATFTAVRDAARELPVVVLTGAADATLGLAAVEAGAEEFLVKGELRGDRLARVLLYSMERHRRFRSGAFHDGLTGLANRDLLADRLRLVLARAVRDRGHVGVLFVDLDGFKAVNDTLGHAAGDRLLVAVAQRFRAALRPGDTLARIGGDEFVAVLDGLPDAGAARRAAERVLALIDAPFTVEPGGGDTPPRQAAVGASIGAAVARPPAGPPVGSDRIEALARELLERADEAMYRVKRRGGRGVLIAEIEGCGP